MDLWQSLGGTVWVTVTSADPTKILLIAQQRNITLDNITWIDDLTIRFCVSRQDFKILNKLLKSRGDKVKIVKKSGIYWRLKGYLRRPVLLTGVLALLITGMYIPSRIYFFRVEGNSTIPTRLILEVAADNGIHFGASRRQIRSEKVKNALLEAIPQLQWVGVNTSGCVATISVKERQTVEQVDGHQGVSSIVADREGVIHEMTVTKGSAACKIGQTVTEGQVLISGYTDCGLSIRAERAQGEIYATTSRENTFKMPLDWKYRGEKQTEVKKYSLIIGKNRINLYKGSGISDTSCVKMYSENYVTLPGGFLLPVAVVTETWIYCEKMTEMGVMEETGDLLAGFAENYLRGQMIAGKILSRKEQYLSEENVLILSGTYRCLEMIGREQNEEIIVP